MPVNGSNEVLVLSYNHDTERGQADMAKKKREPKLRCIAYLSVNGDERTVEKKEAKQLRYIKEYAKAHNIEIVKVAHRSILSQYEVNRHFNALVAKIRAGEIDGIITSNMLAISGGVADAYAKVGKVREAGGHMVTVDEGKLDMHLHLPE